MHKKNLQIQISYLISWISQGVIFRWLLSRVQWDDDIPFLGIEVFFCAQVRIPSPTMYNGNPIIEGGVRKKGSDQLRLGLIHSLPLKSKNSIYLKCDQIVFSNKI